MDKRFVREKGIEVFTGTELILKGALEGRVGLLTGYPGSPVADFFNAPKAVQELLEQKGIVFEIANNEALSAARLNGSQMADIRGIAVVKSVGAHVAADGLALGNLAKTGNQGGAIIVIGDDPWSDSTQVPADSRYISKHLYIPVMEPSTFQEIKDWIPIAFELSKSSNLYMSFIVTTNQADGGGTVQVYPNHFPEISSVQPICLDTAKIPVEDTVVLSPRTSVKEEMLYERYRELLHQVRLRDLNRILYLDSRKRKLGFVTSGLPYCYLEHALYELGVKGKLPIVKLGVTYPVDPEIIKAFARRVDEIIVIEEKRGFLEEQVGMIVKEAYQNGELDGFVPVWGKRFPEKLKGIPETRGINASVLIERLIPLLKLINDPEAPLPAGRVGENVSLLEATRSAEARIPERTPTFCPGCPHRDSASSLLEIKRKFMDASYMRKKHGQGPVDLVFHGDTGCYTMMMFEPNKVLMHNYSGMGLGGGTGAGINRFIKNKQIVFMGDSTFFHSGVIAISDALKNGQDIAFIILDNGTTAMTGHQPTPNACVDSFGHPTFVQDIEKVVKGMAHLSKVPIFRVNPAYRENYMALLEEVILKDGVKIVIADKECGITYDRKVTREEKRIIHEKGYLPEKKLINITPEVCEFCLECTRMTGCPGLTVIDTHFGPKIATDLSWCKSDGACAKTKACPSFEEIIIQRRRPPRKRSTPIDARDLKKPTPRSFDSHWHCYVAGVGGMGIGIITAILVRAGMKQDYEVRFADKKGLAIRNGGVYSHLTYSKEKTILSPIIPYGKADLLLGLDILESVRSLDPKVNIRVGSPAYTTAIVNSHKTPTVATLMGKEDFDPRQLEEIVQRMTIRENYFSVDASEISERLLGNKLYANLLMLGIAYQKGLLPLEIENIEWGIKMSVRPEDLKEDMQAFNLGRRVALNARAYSQEDRFDRYEDILKEKEDILRRSAWNGEQVARAYRELVEEIVSLLKLDEASDRDLAVRLYDLIQYENLEYAKQYAAKIREIYWKDSKDCGYEAVKAVVWNLHRVMVIKDEVYVSHLLTSEEKLKRDRERYHIDPENGDRVIYRHLNRPRFTVFGRNIEFDLVTRNWQLQLMKRAKFLRRLLPDWHREEKEFRDWYLNLVDHFSYHDRESYQAYVLSLRSPEMVKGYREIRYPKMAEAKKFVELLLQGGTKQRSSTAPKEGSGIPEPRWEDRE